MSKLEDLQPKASLRGVLPDVLVTVVSVQWFGSDALDLTYKDPGGKLGSQLLYRHAEPGAGVPVLDAEDVEDLEEAPDHEVEAVEEEILDQATAARTIVELKAEIETLGRLEALALSVRRGARAVLNPPKVSTALRQLHPGAEAKVIDAEGQPLAVRDALAEIARELCYRLYTLCERKKRAAEALSYNGLVQSWPEITRLAREGSTPTLQQDKMFPLEAE